MKFGPLFHFSALRARLGKVWVVRTYIAVSGMTGALLP
jgi:hypothetical protein